MTEPRNGFAKHVRKPYRHVPQILAATVIFRWFNRVTTGERRRLQGVAPVVTGAYIIKTPVGYTKMEGVLRCIHFFKPRVDHYLACFPMQSLQRAHNELQAAVFLGNFMAYEIITDLRHTYLLENAPDIDTWASFGPGAARGLGRMYHQDINKYKRTSTRDQKAMLELSRGLLEMSRDNIFWPWQWPRWEMREVEHALCEYDKYERVRLGQGKLKRKYKRSKA
ncbi:hypothetical protein LCGC14_2265090 [marine sediment metagenome]|uniref:5-hmdU DNA kinase helical domain-containing protein n=1 Tax=marine sediment metagenome TaxID=412755 RepID=A0A0F9FTL4_9ZZZZ